jgi:tRNA A37 threonylcarbamoyladenosine modification protein TsaB
MLILTLDTAGIYFWAILQRDSQILDEIRFEVGNRQAELLSISVENFLSRNHIFYDALDCLSIVNGPGSFMGLKVSMTFTKALRCVFPKLKIILNSVFQILSFCKDFDFVLLEANSDGFYVGDSEKNNFYLSKEEFCNHISVNSCIITNSPNIVDFLKSYTIVLARVDAEGVAALNYSRCVNGYFDRGEIEPVYVRESQVKVGR